MSLGFIFHIGLYSFFGYDDVKLARKRKPENQFGSEYYLQRLQEDKIISGSNSTQRHHIKYGINFDYFRAPLNVTREAIVKWIDICVKCKANYVLITARHHDGFCLWNTKTTHIKSSNDIVKIFKEEAEKKGLIFGIYYSWFDFLNEMTPEYFNSVCIPQINELLTYNPKILWFDGDDKIRNLSLISYIHNMVLYLRSNGILINDRICNTNKELASFSVCRNKTLPESKPLKEWQHVNTIGLSWGYNSDQEDKDFKSGLTLFRMLNNVFSLGGNLLLSIGPKFDGSLDEREEQSLNEFSSYLNVVH